MRPRITPLPASIIPAYAAIQSSQRWFRVPAPAFARAGSARE
jgi:hypothetical protein